MNFVGKGLFAPRGRELGAAGAAGSAPFSAQSPGSHLAESKGSPPRLDPARNAQAETPPVETWRSQTKASGKDSHSTIRFIALTYQYCYLHFIFASPIIVILRVGRF